MAKPKYIKLGNGEEIGLIGMTVERQAEMESRLSGVTSTVRPSEPVAAPVVVASKLPGIAVGINQAADKKTYEVVVVKYDPVTKQAVVESVENVGGLRQDAMNKYKIIAYKHGVL